MKYIIILITITLVNLSAAENECVSLDTARMKLPPSLVMTEGFFMEEYNGLLMIGFGANRKEGVNGIDVKTADDGGYIINGDGAIVMITNRIGGAVELKKTLVNKKIKVGDGKWNIDNITHEVVIFGLNEKLVLDIKTSLEK